MIRVLIIGGYGNFGSYVARALALETNVQLLIAGRSQTKAEAFAAILHAQNPAIGCSLDISGEIKRSMIDLDPDLVIHTTGPFQSQDYRVAEAAIKAGAHYLDLADAREFVAGIGALASEAQSKGVVVISGASSVPCLTAAFIDHYLPAFLRLESADYGISAAQATNRGLGTAAAILSYVGKPFQMFRKGRKRRVFGWQGLHAVRYPDLGHRLFGYCDIPDLALFPDRYPTLQDLSFSAGHEVKLLHLGTWLLSWLVRLRVIGSLSDYAEKLLRQSFRFDGIGSDESGFHMILRGIGHEGAPKEIRIFLIARQGHGPNIPCIPAILLARQIAASKGPKSGARPCLDLITLDEYLGALENLDISLFVEGADAHQAK